MQNPSTDTRDSFRAVDTYHMIYIAKYHTKTLRLRKEQGRPELTDPNDLPEEDLLQDLEANRRHDFQYEESPLTEKEHQKFIYHQAKFCKSHTFYKPHETSTHRVSKVLRCPSSILK